MARLTQAEIRERADEWARKGAEIEKLEGKRDKDIAPALAAYEEAIEPVVAKYQPRIEKLAAERAALEKEITGWLEAQGKPMQLAGELAVASAEVRQGARVIDAQKFFEKVKERTSGFWECVTIAVAKAEKLIGSDKVDEISSKNSKLVASVKVK